MHAQSEVNIANLLIEQKARAPYVCEMDEAKLFRKRK
jgi:hypothetical protein